MNSSIKEDTPRVIALTGSIGSGKSTAGKLFQSLGYTVISADILARAVVEAGTPGLRQIRDVFGSGIILSDGSLDRKGLGQIVFADPDKRKILEKILHPLIRNAFDREVRALWKKAVSNGDTKYIIYDIPLYFETGYQHPWMEKVVTIAAPHSACIERIVARDGLSTVEAEQRLNTQLPIEEKIQKSDYIIENDGTLDQLKNRIEALARTMESLP